MKFWMMERMEYEKSLYITMLDIILNGQKLKEKNILDKLFLYVKTDIISYRIVSISHDVS